MQQKQIFFLKHHIFPQINIVFQSLHHEQQNTAFDMNQFHLFLHYMPVPFVDILHSYSMCQNWQTSKSQHELYYFLKMILLEITNPATLCTCKRYFFDMPCGNTVKKRHFLRKFSSFIPSFLHSLYSCVEVFLWP